MKNYFNILCIFLCFIIIIISSCTPAAKSALDNIDDLIQNYDYQTALKRIEEFKKEYGEYNYSNINAYILEFKCYIAMNDFKNITKDLIDKAENIYNKGMSLEMIKAIKAIGILEYYDIPFLMAYLKSDQVKSANKVIDKYNRTMDLISDEKVLKEFKNSDKDIDSLLQYLVYNSSVEIETMMLAGLSHDFSINIISNEDYRNDIIDYFNYLLNIDISKLKVEYCILTLLDFQMKNGKFYTDILWEQEETKEGFLKLKNSGMVSNDFYNIIKRKVLRKELPESFIKMMEDL